MATFHFRSSITGQIRHLSELDLAEGRKVSCIRVDEFEMLVEAMRSAAEDEEDSHHVALDKADKERRLNTMPPIGTPRIHSAKLRHTKSVDSTPVETRRAVYSGASRLTLAVQSAALLTPRKMFTDRTLTPSSTDRHNSATDKSCTAGVLRKSSSNVSNPYRRIANAADIDRHYATGRKVSFNDELVLIDEDGTANRINSHKYQH